MKALKIALITIITFSLATGCGCSKKEKDDNKKEEEVKVNTNQDVIKDQTLEVFEFKNTSLIYENNSSRLETSVTNTGSETEYLAEFKIHVKDSEGNEIVEMTGFFGGEIKAGETKVIDSYYGEDLTKAASIDYEIVR